MLKCIAKHPDLVKQLGEKAFHAAVSQEPFNSVLVKITKDASIHSDMHYYKYNVNEKQVLILEDSEQR